MPTSPRPYRLTPGQATADALAAYNATEGLPVMAIAQDPETAIQQIAQARQTSDPYRRREQGWVQHPDERVAVAVLERPDLWNGRDSERDIPADAEGAVARLALARGTSEVADGVLWTPVLDALVAHHGTNVLPVNIDDPAPSDSARQVAALLSQIDAWVRTQTDPRAVEPLLHFESLELRTTVLRALRTPLAPLVERLVESARGENGDSYYVEEQATAVAQNPGLTAADHAQLTTAALERIVAKSKAPGMDFARPWLPTLIALDRPDLPFPASVKATLRRRAAAESHAEIPHVVAAMALASLPSTSEAELRKLYARFSGREPARDLVEALVRHPNASPALWQTIAEVPATRAWSSYRTMFLAEHPAARQVPAVRAVLLTAPKETVLRHLWQDASFEEFLETFRDHVAREGCLLPATLAAAPEAYRAALTRADWEPLVSSTHRDRNSITLSSIPSARQSSEAREVMTAHWFALGWADMLRLVSDPMAGTAEERHAMFGRFVANDIPEFLDRLEREEPALLAFVTPEDMAPALASRFAPERQRALLVASRLRLAGDAPPQPAPPARARVGR